ncbi:MAG: SDR family NAD(P)-dependent oxidoreductase, partial [Pseudomonadota bacterium]
RGQSGAEMTIRFDGKTVLVTGAASGLGEAHALGFAARGATVLLNDIASADTVRRAVEKAGGTAHDYPCDITDADAVANMSSTIETDHGTPDVLVNNAGILRDRSFHKLSEGEWDAVLAVHLSAAARLTRAFWPNIRIRGTGRIIFTTSSSGLYGNFGQANYGAAKMGLVGLMRTLMIEGANADVKINAIAPVAWTPMTAGLFPPAAQQIMRADQVTPGVLFLASDAAPNGAILCAGGGAYSTTHIVETPPTMLGADATADDVAAHFSSFGDPRNARPVANGPLQTAQFFDAVLKGADQSVSR